MNDKFTKIKTNDLIQELRQDESFKQEFDAQAPFYEVLAAIYDLRISQGITQKALAQKIGLCPGDLSRIERGKINTTIKTLQKIADVMGKKLHIEFI